MTFSINGRVFPYIIKSSILCILFAFIASILGEKWFILFLLSFCLLPLFAYMYREKNSYIIHSSKCLSPCDGIISFVVNNSESKQIVFKCGIFDTYQKKSPIAGIINKIIKYDIKDLENPSGILFEIQNDLGVFTLEIFHGTSMKPNIDVVVEEGGYVKQGENLCFIEFGSKIRLVLPNNLELNVQKDMEVVSGISHLVV